MPSAQAAEGDIVLSDNFLTSNSSGPGWTFTSAAEADYDNFSLPGRYWFTNWDLFEITGDVTITGDAQGRDNIPMAFHIADGAKVTWKADYNAQAELAVALSHSDGTFELADGSIKNKGRDGISDGLISDASHAQVVIDGGQIDTWHEGQSEGFGLLLADGSLDMVSGKIKSWPWGIALPTGFQATISGGEIEALYPVRGFGSGTLDITGGTIIGDSLVLNPRDPGAINISGGTFEMDKKFASLWPDTGKDIVSSDYDVTIDGNAVIWSTAGDDSADVTAGIVFRATEGTVYGTVTLAEDMILDPEQTLDVPEGAVLQVPAGVTFSGEILGDGTVNDGNDPSCLLNATLTVKNQTYSGKSKKPSVKVVLDSKTLKKNRDYTVKYAHNKSIGQASVEVSGKGAYKCVVTTAFTIKPKANKVTKTKTGKRYAKVYWSKPKGGAQYVEVQYHKSGSKTKHVKLVKASKGSLKIKGLSKSKKYVFKVRAVKNVNGELYYSSWSKSKTTKKVK
jgi:hypothetical protein